MTEAEKAAAEAKAKAAEADEKAKAQAAADEKARAAKAAEDKKANAKRARFHVVGPGSVTFGGATYAKGDELELTQAEATSLGAAVAPGFAPAAPEDVSKRKAGRYRVRGPGSVWHSGKLREKGAELELDELDARTLGATVEPVG